MTTESRVIPIALTVMPHGKAQTVIQIAERLDDLADHYERRDRGLAIALCGLARELRQVAK